MLGKVLEMSILALNTSALGQRGQGSGSTSTTSFSMAVPLTTFSGQRAEMSVLETNRYLRSQLEESKQKFRDLTEKYLTSTATAYCLANHLQKYKCEEYKDLIESVLEEELQYEEKEPVEKSPAARLGKYDPLIQAQAQELTNLRQKIQEGRSFCYLFSQHVKNTVESFEGLLRNTDIAHYQGQRLREQLAQGSQLAESLASKLTRKNHNGKMDEDTQELLVSRLSRDVQEAELKDSLDERYLTGVSRHDSQQPPSSNAFLSGAQEATSALDVANDEIRNLEQHLRETLFINDCLREKLEYHLSIFDQRNGCNSNLYRQILDSIAQLYNENRVLWDEYQRLPACLNRTSRGNN
nr:neuroblastoma breakpoint family member 6-like protein isoform X3 [Microcebus murinus]